MLGDFGGLIVGQVDRQVDGQIEKDRCTPA